MVARVQELRQRRAGDHRIAGVEEDRLAELAVPGAEVGRCTLVDVETCIGRQQGLADGRELRRRGCG